MWLTPCSGVLAHLAGGCGVMTLGCGTLDPGIWNETLWMDTEREHMNKSILTHEHCLIDADKVVCMRITRDCDGVVLSLARDYCVLADLTEYDKSVTTKLFDELLDFMTDPEIYYFSIPRSLEDYPRLMGCGA